MFLTCKYSFSHLFKIFVVLFSIVMLLIIGKQTAHANYSCEWTMVPVESESRDLPGICVGAPSEADLRSAKLELGCVGNCGGIINRIINSINGSDTTRIALDGDILIGTREDGSAFTCFGGYWDDSVEATVNNIIQDQQIACPWLTLTSFAIAPGGFLATLAVGSIGGNLACNLTGVAFSMPVLQARIYDQNNNQQTFCEAKIDAQVGHVFLSDVQRGYDFCLQAGSKDSPSFTQCKDCLENNNGIWTSFGCIPSSSESIVRSLIKLSIGVAGGLALLFIIFGSFTIATSVGDPQKLQTGQQMISSAIIGILLIVFAVVILNIIGVQILAIPEF